MEALLRSSFIYTRGCQKLLKYDCGALNAAPAQVREDGVDEKISSKDEIDAWREQDKSYG